MQHDSAPVHHVMSMKACVAESPEWSAENPELNPIKQLCGELELPTDPTSDPQNRTRPSEKSS